MDTELNKEQVYDAQINPLMARIIEICHARKIAFVASFSIPTASDPELACSTALLGNDFEPPARLVDAWRVIREGHPSLGSPSMLRTVHADGSITLTAIVG